jgi:hypothetical protein
MIAPVASTTASSRFDLRSMSVRDAGRMAGKAKRTPPSHGPNAMPMIAATAEMPAPKEPINDARHVRNAVARFDQVEGVTDAERDAAWKRIRAAARRFGVQIHAKGWRSLMKQSPDGAGNSQRSTRRG